MPPTRTASRRPTMLLALAALACGACVAETGDDSVRGFGEAPLELQELDACALVRCGEGTSCESGVCVPSTPFCAVLTRDDAESVYAGNFAHERAARRFRQRFGPGVRLELLRGTCADQRSACQQLAEPVCGDVTGLPDDTYGNRCELRAAVIRAAGAEGRAKGSVLHEGACHGPCAARADCAEGQYCTTETGACDAPPGCEVGSPCPTVCYGACRELSTRARP